MLPGGNVTRIFTSAFCLFLSLIFVVPVFADQEVKPQHAISMHGTAKYKEGETFAYVNPEAPKGGEIRLGVVGNFDSLNPFVTKGEPAAGLSNIGRAPVYVYDALMQRSQDEPFTVYGRLAESVEMPEDRSSIIFNIRPEAKWADGKPVTAEDVEFTYKILLEKGRPNIRLFYSRVSSVEVLGPRRIKFSFEKLEDEDRYNPEMPLLMGLMIVLPKHALAGKDLEKIVLQPILGSGPYRIKDFQAGKTIVYERRPDYWGRDIPVNRGKYNFDQIHIEYYRNAQVAQEAFKAGYYDVRGVTEPTEWKHMRYWPPVKRQQIVLAEIPHSQPVGVYSMVFNSRRAPFNDPLVRKALIYVFDFEWANKNLFHGFYTRTSSFFDNTEMVHFGPPAGKELELLEPFRDVLPKEVFLQDFKPPRGGNALDRRHNLQKAKALLRKAGWGFSKGKLLHLKNHEPLKFEILSQHPSEEKIALAYARSLKFLGIDARVRIIDTAQYVNRRLQFDYDVLVNISWGQTASPGREQSFYYSSEAVDESGSRNYPGIKDPVVDSLCETIATAIDRETLVAAARALDRVLASGHYVLFLYHQDKHYMAYWDKFGHPPFKPEIPSALTNWWQKGDEKTKVALSLR